MRQSINVNPNILEVWAGFEFNTDRKESLHTEKNIYCSLDNWIATIKELSAKGVTHMHYPLLQELILTVGKNKIDWSEIDRKLEFLRENNIKPIIGLAYQNKEQGYSSTDHQEFNEKITSIARAVAERYPWLEYFTPLNIAFKEEYCNNRTQSNQTDKDFAQAIVNQSKATIQATRNIKRVIPNAKFVYTECMNKEGMQESDNLESWISLDLLTGRLSPEDATWNYLIKCGVSENDLHWFLTNNCSLAIIGINYSISPEQNLATKPISLNGKDRTSDTTVPTLWKEELQSLLQQTWERYQLPLALTEVSIAAQPDEQTQLLQQIWDLCEELGERGIELKAVAACTLPNAQQTKGLDTLNKVEEIISGS